MKSKKTALSKEEIVSELMDVHMVFMGNYYKWKAKTGKENIEIQESIDRLSNVVHQISNNYTDEKFFENKCYLDEKLHKKSIEMHVKLLEKYTKP